MPRNAAADLALCEAATRGPWIVRNANGRPAVWMKDSRCKIASVEAPDEMPAIVNVGRARNSRFIAEARKMAPYWIQVAEAYRELAEARNEMLLLTQTHRPVAEIMACSDRIGEAKAEIKELEAK